MDDNEQQHLRNRLREYPGATPESVEVQLSRLEEREEEKRALVERGYSNALAEAFLDRKGWPRPPGWHSVFFYPGSSRPRNMVFFWLAVLAVAAWFLFA